MCKYCENEKRIEFDDGETTWHIQNTEKGYEMIYANNDTGRLKAITISYCPICGRKLTEECDCYENYDFKEKIAKLEDRHQSDCITINQLNVTIDTLAKRYVKLMEIKGLM